MNANDTQQRLRTLFSTILEVPPESVNADLSPQTCTKWDSLNQIHIVNGIEEEFDFSMPFEDQMRLMSFAIAEEIVAFHMAQKGQN